MLPLLPLPTLMLMPSVMVVVIMMMNASVSTIVYVASD